MASDFSGADTTSVDFLNNTFYGAAGQARTAIYYSTTGSYDMRLVNNVFYGWTTPISFVDANNFSAGFYNDFYNNTNLSANWAPGSSDKSLDPQFANLGQIANTSANYATSSTNVLTDNNQTFTGNVTADVDVVYLVSGSGTGFQAGLYPIHAVGTHTLTLGDRLGNAFYVTSSGAGSSILYQITTGHNFSIGANLTGAGFPGVFQGGLTTGHTSIGAVQSQGSAGVYALPIN